MCGASVMCAAVCVWGWKGVVPGEASSSGPWGGVPEFGVINELFDILLLDLRITGMIACVCTVLDFNTESASFLTAGSTTPVNCSKCASGTYWSGSGLKTVFAMQKWDG